MKFGYLISLCFVCAIACAPSARPGDGVQVQADAGTLDSGSKPGVGAGGKGGTSSMNTGGSGGLMAMGGANAAGAGGAPKGGMGGAAAGGMAGMVAMGGMPGGAGGVDMPPPGPIAKPSGAVFFSGTTNAVSKVVAGDASPGYFYVARLGGMATLSVEALSAADQMGLPAGVTFAQRTTNTTAAGESALIIFGFNFRPNDGMKFRWIDATDFAGFSFWAKISTGGIDLSTTTVDATNVKETDPAVGTCTVPMCVSVHGKVVAGTTTWTRFKFKWSDFTVGPESVQGPVEVKQMGRIDVLFVVPSGSTVDYLMTDIKLNTAAELN